MAKSIAIIGDSESIKGFGAVGMDLFLCETDSRSIFHIQHSGLLFSEQLPKDQV